MNNTEALRREKETVGVSLQLKKEIHKDVTDICKALDIRIADFVSKAVKDQITACKDELDGILEAKRIYEDRLQRYRETRLA